MRQRDILRMWATIVRHTGQDKYSNEEWQESFEFFCRCMQSPKPPYIENIDQLVKMEIEELAKPKQSTRNTTKNSPDVKLTDDSNNSSDICEDSQPLSVLKKRLKLQNEPKATSNIFGNKLSNESEKNLSEQKPSKSSALTTESPTKCRRTRGQIEKIEQSECQPEMAKTEKKEELDILQAQIEKQKIKKNVKKDSIKEERLIEQSNPIKDQQQERTGRKLKDPTDSKVLKSEKPIKANDLRIQDQKQQRNVKKGTIEKQALNQDLNDKSKSAKLNTRTRSKRQSKLKPINGIRNAHMPPTPINLTYEAPTSASEEPLQSTEIAENLIVKNQVSSRSDRNSISSDISEIVVEDNLPPIPMDESLLIDLQIDGYQDINQLLVEDNADLIIDGKGNSDGDVMAKDEIERYLQCYSAKTPSEIDHEMADTSSFFDNIPNLTTETIDVIKTTTEIDHETADCSNLLEDIPNLTTESIEMLQTPSKMNHDIANATSSYNNILTTDTEETTENKLDHEMADASNLFNNIPNLPTGSIEMVKTPSKINIENADTSNSFNNILSETTDNAETTETSATKEMLKTPSPIDHDVADTSNFFDNIPDLTTEATGMLRTPLELETIIQNVLNYDFDDDALSVTTSWDGEDILPSDTQKTFEPESYTKDVQNIQDKSEKAEKIEKVKPNQQLNVDVSDKTKKSENEEPNRQLNAEIGGAKNNLEELRSFRIPKKAETKEIPTNQINEQQVTREKNPQKQRQLNGYQKQQKESIQLEQRPLNGYQKLNGQIQAKPTAQTVPRNHHSHEQQMARSNCNESMPTTSARVPIFAPPYRLPVEPTPSLPIISSVNDNDNGMSEIFGIKCWHNISGKCFKTNCIHQLAHIGDIKRRLELMNDSQLVVAYHFVVRHKFLFKFCFLLFAEGFGSRSMQTKLVGMVDHCDLYLDYSVPFTTEIFYVMLQYNITPEVASSHFMKYLWKPSNAVMYPDLAIQLLRILAGADWYNYTSQLEELFSHKEFQTPIEFIVSIAKDAFAKNQPQLIDKLYEVILFIPFGRNRDTLTSIFTILQKVPQQQQQKEMEPHEIQRQLVEVQLQLQLIQQQHMQQQPLQQQLMQQQHMQQYQVHQQHLQQQSLQQHQLQQQQHTQQQHTSKQNTQQQHLNQQHTQQQPMHQHNMHMQQHPIHQQPIHQQLMQLQSIHQQQMQQQSMQQQPVHQQPIHQHLMQQQPLHQQPIHQQIMQKQQKHIQQHQLHQNQQQLHQHQLQQQQQQHIQQLPRQLSSSMQ